MHRTYLMPEVVSGTDPGVQPDSSAATCGSAAEQWSWVPSGGPPPSVSRTAEGPAGACAGGALGVVGVVQQAPWSFQTPQSPVLPGVSFWVHHWALYVRPLWETSSPAL